MKSAPKKNCINHSSTFILPLIIVSLLSTFIPYFKIDLLITKAIQDVPSHFFSKTMWFVSTIGNIPYIIIIVAATCLLFYIFNQKKEAVLLSLTTVGSALSGSLIKTLVNRPRPSEDLVQVSVWLSDKSFPSNHTLVFTLFFGFLLYLLFYKQKRTILHFLFALILFFPIATIGLSRIYLGVHWASDVLGGYLLGIIWLIFTIRLYNSYHGKR
ncbi:MAG TPA: phosphatase PAP2 family protein [Spirochaetia bacterium]|nr:phosphatase PAP2 family protein [Spirochaetia bacterium]